eukprot:tig00000350_g24339.t1
MEGPGGPSRAASQARSLGGKSLVSSRSVSGLSVSELLERSLPPKGLGSSASAAQLRAKSTTPPAASEVVPPGTLDDALVFGYGNVRSTLALQQLREPPRGPAALSMSEAYLRRIRAGKGGSKAGYRSAEEDPERQRALQARNAALAPSPPSSSRGWSETSPLALYVRRIRGPGHVLPVRKQVGVIGNVERIIGLAAMKPGEERRETDFCYLTRNGLMCITGDGRSDFISISKHMREDYQYRILGTMKVFRLWRHWKIFRAWKNLTKWRLFKKTRKKLAKKLIAHWPRFHQCILEVAGAVEPVAGLQLVIVKPHAGMGLADFVETQTKHELLMKNYIRDCLRAAVARIDRCIREERAARAQDEAEVRVDPLPRLARLIRLCEYVVLEAMLLAAVRSVEEFLAAARLDSAALFRVTVSLDPRSQVTMEPEANLLAEAVGQLLKNTLTQLRHQPRVIFHPPFHEMLHASGISAKALTNPVNGMDIGAYLAGTPSFREQVAAVRSIIEASFEEATKAAAAYAELSLVHAAAQRWPATPGELRASVMARCNGDLANLVTLLHDDVRKFRKWGQDIARTRGVTVRGVLVLDSNAMKGQLAPFPRAAIAQLEGLAAAIAGERTEELHARMDEALRRLEVDPEELDAYVEQRAFCAALPATIAEVSGETQVLSEVLALLAHAKGKGALERAAGRHALLYGRVALAKRALAASSATREPMLVFYRVALEQVAEAAALAVLALLEGHRATAAKMRAKAAAVLEQQRVMGVDEVALRPVEVLDAELTLLRALWEAVDAWKRLEAVVYFEQIKELRGDEIAAKITELGRQATQLNEALKQRSGTGEEQPVAGALERALQPQLRKLPVIKGLASGAMQRRHWERLERALFIDYAPDMTLTQLEARKLHDYAALVLELAAMAAAEQALAQQFQAIVDTWETRTFEVGPAEAEPREREREGAAAGPGKEEWLRVHNAEEVEAALVAHAALLRAMQSSPHNALIKAQDLQREQLRLAGMLDTVRALLAVQGSVTYLRSFFWRADSKATLGPETRLFEGAARRWADVLAGVQKDGLVARVGANRLMLPLLTECGDTLGRVREALEGSLQHKRALFPRFFALSNDDLLEVLASDPERAVQAHLWKLFDGVRAFETHALPEEAPGAGRRLEIVAVVGPLGERVALARAVPVKGALEAWLQNLERTLSQTLADALPAAVECAVAGLKASPHWPLAFPAQTVAAALRVAFARRVHTDLAPLPSLALATARSAPAPPPPAPLAAPSLAAPSVAGAQSKKGGGRRKSLAFDASSAAPDSPRSSLERRMAAAESEFHTAVVTAATLVAGALSAVDATSRGVPNALRLLAPPGRPESHRLEGAAAQWGERLETWATALRLVRGPVARARLQQVIVLGAHLRDSFEELARGRLERAEDPAFQSRLRLYYDPDLRQLTARALTASVPCTFEFKGTAGGLEGGAVMTPAAERCMAAVLCALQHGPAAGALLFGPAGAGRGETLRELAYILGRRLISVSCAEGGDAGPEAEAAAARDVQHWLAGAVTTGAWLCVRGLERLGAPVLSLLAEQLRAVQRALEERAGLVTIGRGLSALRLPVSPTFGFFAAAEPGVGHPALLAALPASLVSQLRPLHLQPPDARLLASVLLQAAGFESHHLLAPKIARFYAVLAEAPADAADEEGVGGPAAFGPGALRAALRAAAAELRAVQAAGHKDPLRLAALAAARATRGRGGGAGGVGRGPRAAAAARAARGGLLAGALRRTVEALFPSLQAAGALDAAAAQERLTDADVLAAVEASGRLAMPEQVARPGSGKTAACRLVVQARELRAQRAAAAASAAAAQREGAEAAAQTQRPPQRLEVSLHVFHPAALDAPPPPAQQAPAPGQPPAAATPALAPHAAASAAATPDGREAGKEAEGGAWPPVAFLEAVSRAAAGAGPGAEHWALFDGPLGWFGAERLLPGLHDPLSGVRTLGRDQTMPGRAMQVLLEAPDAAGASPAALASCATVYFPPSAGPDWRAALALWLHRLPRSLQGAAKERLRALGESLLPEALERTRAIAAAARLSPGLQEALPGREALSVRAQDAALARGALELLRALLAAETEGVNLNLNFASVGVLFAFSLVWGVAAARGLAGSPETRRAFDAWCRNRFKDLCELPDARGTVFDYHISIAEQSLQPWTPASPPPLGPGTPVVAPLPGGAVFVWHGENAPAGYVARVLMEAGKPALLLGTAGCGKSGLAAQVLQRAPARLELRLTPLARASALDGELRARVTRSRRLFPGRRVTVLVDDLHLPASAAAGAGEAARGFLPLEVLRLAAGAGALPDNRSLGLFHLSDVHLLATAACGPAACEPPASGRPRRSRGAWRCACGRAPCGAWSPNGGRRAGAPAGAGGLQAAAVARTVLPRWAKSLAEASVALYARVAAALAKGEVPGLERERERGRPGAADGALFGPRLRDLAAVFEALRHVRPDWIRDLNGNVDGPFARLWATRLVAALCDRLPTESPAARVWVAAELIDKYESRMADPPPKGLAEELADPAGLSAFWTADKAGEERDGSYKAMSAADVRSALERAIAEALAEDQAAAAAAAGSGPGAKPAGAGAPGEGLVWPDGALRRLLAVSRALRQPPRAGGHALLVSQGAGAGRRTLARLAARIAGYEFAERARPLVLYVPPRAAADEAALDLLHSITVHGRLPVADAVPGARPSGEAAARRLARASRAGTATLAPALSAGSRGPSRAGSRRESRVPSREGTPAGGSPREGREGAPANEEDASLATAGRVHVVAALDCPSEAAWGEAARLLQRFPALAAAAAPVVFGPLAGDGAAMEARALAAFARASLEFGETAPASVAKLLANLHRAAARFCAPLPSPFVAFPSLIPPPADEGAGPESFARVALLDAMDAVIAHFGAQAKRCDDAIRGVAAEERALEEVVARDVALVTRSRAIVDAKARAVGVETEARRKKDEEDARRRTEAEAAARAAFNTHVRNLTRIEIAELDSTDANPELVSALMHAVCVVFDVPASLEGAWRVLRSPSLLPDLDIAGFAAVRAGERDRSEQLLEALAPVRHVPPESYDAICKAAGGLFRYMAALGEVADALKHHKAFAATSEAEAARLDDSRARLREMEAALAAMAEGLEHSRARFGACAARLAEAEARLADAQALVRRAVQLKETLKQEDGAGWLGEDSGGSGEEGRGLALAARAAAASVYAPALAPPARRALLAAWGDPCAAPASPPTPSPPTSARPRPSSSPAPPPRARRPPPASPPPRTRRSSRRWRGAGRACRSSTIRTASPSTSCGSSTPRGGPAGPTPPPPPATSRRWAGEEPAPGPTVTLAGTSYAVKPGFRLYLATCEESLRLPAWLLQRTAAVDLGWGGRFPEAEAVARALLLDVARSAAETAGRDLLAAVAAEDGAGLAEQAGLERAERLVADLAAARAAAAAAAAEFARLDAERQRFAPLAAAAAALAASAARFAESRPAAQIQLAPLRRALAAAAASSPFRGLVARPERERRPSVAARRPSMALSAAGASTARSTQRSLASLPPRRPQPAPPPSPPPPTPPPRPRPASARPRRRRLLRLLLPRLLPRSARSAAGPDAPAAERPDSPPGRTATSSPPPPLRLRPRLGLCCRLAPADAGERGGRGGAAEQAEAMGRHAEAVRARLARALLVACGRALARRPRAQLALALALPGPSRRSPSRSPSSPSSPPRRTGRPAPAPAPAPARSRRPSRRCGPARRPRRRPLGRRGEEGAPPADEKFAWVTPAVLRGAAALAAAEPAVFGRLPERITRDPGGDWFRWALAPTLRRPRPAPHARPGRPAGGAAGARLVPVGGNRRASLNAAVPIVAGARRVSAAAGATAREEGGEGAAGPPLGPLRRLCLVKALCGARLPVAALRFAEEALGPDVGDACFEELWRLVSDGAGPTRPLLLLCPPGFDPRDLLNRAAADVGHEGVLFVAAAPEGDAEGTLEAVEVAAGFGRWMVLENAHAFAADAAAAVPRLLARLGATPGPDAPLGSSFSPEGEPGPSVPPLLGPAASSPGAGAGAGAPQLGARAAVAAAMAAASSKSRDRLHTDFRLVITADASAPLPRWLLSACVRFHTDLAIFPSAITGGGGKAAAVAAAAKRRQSVGGAVREEELRRALRQGAECSFAYLLSRARRGPGLRGAGRLLPPTSPSSSAPSTPRRRSSRSRPAERDGGRALRRAAAGRPRGALRAAPGHAPPRGTSHPPAAALLFGADELEALPTAASGIGRVRRASLAPPDAAQGPPGGGRRASAMSNAQAAAAAVAAVAAEAERAARWQGAGGSGARCGTRRWAGAPEAALAPFAGRLRAALPRLLAAWGARAPRPLPLQAHGALHFGPRPSGCRPRPAPPTLPPPAAPPPPPPSPPSGGGGPRRLPPLVRLLLHALRGTVPEAWRPPAPPAAPTPRVVGRRRPRARRAAGRAGRPRAGPAGAPPLDALRYPGALMHALCERHALQQDVPLDETSIRSRLGALAPAPSAPAGEGAAAASDEASVAVYPGCGAGGGAPLGFPLDLPSAGAPAADYAWSSACICLSPHP